MNENNNPYAYYEPTPLNETGPRRGLGRYTLNDYADPSSLTTILLILLVLAILTDALGLVSDFQQVHVIRNIQTGAYETEETQEAAVEAADTMVGVIGLGQAAISILLGIIFFVWTYRVCKNAHCLSLTSLENTPGWAVGWYFVPIANLWKPYYALKEAYIESYNADHSRPRIAEAPLILFWWIIHIISVFIGQISWRLTTGMTELSTTEQWHAMKWSQIGSEGIEIPLNILTIIVVLVFVRHQREGFERRNNDFR